MKGSPQDPFSFACRMVLACPSYAERASSAPLSKSERARSALMSCSSALATRSCPRKDIHYIYVWLQICNLFHLNRNSKYIALYNYIIYPCCNVPALFLSTKIPCLQFFCSSHVLQQTGTFCNSQLNLNQHAGSAPPKQ